MKLDPPRWPGGPPICPQVNLPAFESEKAAGEFRQANGPSVKVKMRETSTGEKVARQWKCDHCGHWHFESEAPDPAGQSSGNGRGGSGAPLGFAPFQRPETMAFVAAGKSSRSTNQPDLEQKAAPPDTSKWKGPLCVKCDWPVKSGKCSNADCETNKAARAAALPKRQAQQEGSLF